MDRMGRVMGTVSIQTGAKTMWEFMRPAFDWYGTVAQ